MGPLDGWGGSPTQHIPSGSRQAGEARWARSEEEEEKEEDQGDGEVVLGASGSITAGLQHGLQELLRISLPLRLHCWGGTKWHPALCLAVSSSGRGGAGGAPSCPHVQSARAACSMPTHLCPPSYADPSALTQSHPPLCTDLGVPSHLCQIIHTDPSMPTHPH